jgi:hypothetical protein
MGLWLVLTGVVECMFSNELMDRKVDSSVGRASSQVKDEQNGDRVFVYIKLIGYYEICNCE